ncbi:MAG: TIGR03767 family metallophosphoesterase, partial [bacterium]
MTTRDRTLRSGAAAPGGYRTLRAAPGEGWRTRSLDGAPAPDPTDADPILALVHLSDTHVMDAQSPARVEFLDRFIDLAAMDEGRTYRPQEVLTTQVLDAMARAVGTVARAPFSGRPLDVALLTGDTTDSAQANELEWLADVLDGRSVTPDSGDPARYEGVGSPRWPDPAYWHPEQPSGAGYPVVPGFHEAARRAFRAGGLPVPWLTVYGNHDGLVQGTLPVSDATTAHAVGSLKPVTAPEEVDPAAARDLLDGVLDERTLAVIAGAGSAEVSPDPRRRHLTRAEHIAWHLGRGGHGLTEANRDSGTAYYRQRLGEIDLVVLDTVNEHGGWQGSLDAEQLHWLRAQLDEADTGGRPAIIASHHTAADLVNAECPPGAVPRVLRDGVLAELHRHPCVIAWLDGHTHATRIRAHPGPAGGFWEITAPSLIDWPQQARIVEVLRTAGGFALATTMLDHAAPPGWDPALPDSLALAALSRELSANSWGVPRPVDPDSHPRRGAPSDRNAVLLVP